LQGLPAAGWEAKSGLLNILHGERSARAVLSVESKDHHSEFLILVGSSQDRYANRAQVLVLDSTENLSDSFDIYDYDQNATSISQKKSSHSFTVVATVKHDTVLGKPKYVLNINISDHSSAIKIVQTSVVSKSIINLSRFLHDRVVYVRLGDWAEDWETARMNRT